MSLTDKRPLNNIIKIESLRKTVQISNFIKTTDEPPPEMCLECRGTKLLCGKSRCPIIAKAESISRVSTNPDSTHIEGTAPPGVFVGRFGYPKVFIGPMTPNYFGNTEILDTPEQWNGKSIDEIIDFRHSLIRGNTTLNIHDASKGGKFVENIQELGMASKPVDLELNLTKKPHDRMSFHENSQPFGPSAPLKSFHTNNISVDQRIEKAYYDRDLKASNGIVDLYNKGVLVSRIQKTLSVGNLGIGNKRKFVPTRWSITAVDDTISKSLIKEIKQFPTIDDFRVYYLKNLDNLYVSILLPIEWQFEWIEAWFPNTTWNMWGREPYLLGDHESYHGRKQYAQVGGCYYSTRLAVAESLFAERKQAGSLLFREIHPGYILPVGVWNVRESIRHQLKTNYQSFDNLSDALKYAFSKLTIKKNHWLNSSYLLNHLLFQRRLTEYF